VLGPTLRRRERRVQWLLVALLVAALAAAGAAAPGSERARTLWGIAGGYTDGQLADLRNRGVGFVLIEMRWAQAEPRRGTFDEHYFESVRALVRKARAGGYRVMLNFGLDHAPRWVLDAHDRLGRPIGRFVNQYGGVYAGDQPNLVFSRELRRFAASYVRRVFSNRGLGNGFYVVRVGGGYLGELTYPYEGRSFRYWAFDASARADNPVPRYRPCRRHRGQARRFLGWYFDRLADYQNWQIRAVRRWYSGPIAVVYPSWGVRRGDVARALADNLCGRSSAELNGEIQRGLDHARQIRRLPRMGKLVVWGSWVDNASYSSWIFGLADRRGLAKMGENSGDSTDIAAMSAAFSNARTFGLTAFMWVRAAQAYCRCGVYASIDDYEHLIHDQATGTPR
jgi:hypothetical protein